MLRCIVDIDVLNVFGFVELIGFHAPTNSSFYPGAGDPYDLIPHWDLKIIGEIEPSFIRMLCFVLIFIIRKSMELRIDGLIRACYARDSDQTLC